MIKPKDGSFTIIIHNKKILLFLRDDKPTIPYPNHWQLPGGQIEEGETPLEALKRELKEEVSYAPRTIYKVGYFPAKDNVKSHLYIAFVDDSEVKRFKHGPGEGQMIEFFPREKLEKLNLTINLKHFLNKYPKVVKRIFEENYIPKASDFGLVSF